MLRGEGIHLLRGEASAAIVRAATRRRGAEAQVAAPTLTLVLPLAPTVVALLFVFGRAARATGRAGGEREDDGDDTHRKACGTTFATPADVSDGRGRRNVVPSKSRAPRLYPRLVVGNTTTRAYAVQFITAAMMYSIYAVHS